MPAPDPISLRNPRAAEVVARELRRQIVRGELPAGHALPSESALTEQFEVSRPTLREAFRVLEHEGLVEIRRGVRGGARVRAPDENLVSNYAGLLLQYRGTTIADLFGARAALEAPAARMLAARPSRKEIVKRLGAETEEHANDLANPARAPAFHRLVVELAAVLGTDQDGEARLGRVAQGLRQHVSGSLALRGRIGKSARCLAAADSPPTLGCG